MCKQCQEATERHYGHLSDEDKMHLLWSATAFPFCGPDYLENQLIELKENTDGSLGQAQGYADKQMSETVMKDKK